MHISLVLGLLFTPVVLIAWVWLVIVGARRHLGWGLAIFLFSPISALIYGVRYWDEAKKPFLVLMGSYVLWFAFFVHFFVAMGGGGMLDLAERMERGEISEEEAGALVMARLEELHRMGLISDEDMAEARSAYAENRGSAADANGETMMRELLRQRADQEQIAPAPPSARPQATTPADDAATLSAPAAPARREVPVSEASRYIGQTLYVTGSNGAELRGTLREIEGDTLRFERRMRGGVFAFEMTRANIRTLHADSP